MVSFHVRTLFAYFRNGCIIQPWYLVFTSVHFQFLDYIMYQPLVVEVWGKQSDAESKGEDKNNNNRETMSTKQLMNAESVSKANIISQSGRGDDDDKYRLASELNSTKKRNDKLNSRMVSFLRDF